MSIVIKEGNSHTIDIQSVLTQYQIHGQGHIDVLIQTMNDVHGDLYLEVEGQDIDLHIQTDIKQGANVNVTLVNKVSGTLTYVQQSKVAKDAYFNLGFADLESKSLEADIHVELNEEGAHADVLTVSRVDGKKNCKVHVIHHVPHTQSDTQNFAIVNENGNYKMEAIGEIIKGAHDSVCHQSSRVLTTSSKQVSDVLPVLLIDENEVKASHATTVGQPDAQQLYYLQSRGLTHAQALGLLTIGYLLPITEVIKDEELKEDLKQYVEKKVGLHV